MSVLLTATRARALDRPELIHRVRTIADNSGGWLPLVQHQPARRWWTRLAGDDQLDVWLLTWPRGGATELHDHGVSGAALTVVEGALEEVRASSDGDLRRSRVRAGEVRWVPPGRIHDVRNPTDRPAVSVHGYSPPLRRMTYYQRGPGRLDVVRTLCSDEPEAVDTW